MLVQELNLYYNICTCRSSAPAWSQLERPAPGVLSPVRATVALFAGVSLLIQLIPVAPPRLLPGTGLVDTAARYRQGGSVGAAASDADEFSAMPSVHVGWALIVAIAVITASRSRWRWLAASARCSRCSSWW